MGFALVPLRVPAGWAVVFNIFVELPEPGELSATDVESFLTEDILSIEQLRLAGSHWQSDRQGALLDLSWYPSGDPGGEYVLSVLIGGWDGPQAEFRHRDADRVRAAIELALLRFPTAETMPSLAAQLNELNS